MRFRKKVILISTILFSSLISQVVAKFPNRYNVVQYWGQNSARSPSSKSLASCCDEHTDVLILSFLIEFNVGGLPTLNFANACVDTYFNGTTLLKCDAIAADIKTCQSKGKRILLSLGGASGSYGFSNDADANTFAKTLWDLFGAGNSNTRPFGDAVIDGFDLDIEGGSPTGYTTLVKALRSLFASDPSKDYYITAAPQCPFPDSVLGTVIDSIGMDAIIVQFYNNYCGAGTPAFNFDTWDKWAKNTAPNKDVKIFLGIPGSTSAASSGYVQYSQLESIVGNVKSTFSNYGGVAIWDASQSYGNVDVLPHYAGAVGRLVHNTTDPADGTTTTLTSKTSTKTTTSSSAPTSAPTQDTGVTNGGPCSTEGKYVCTGSNYAVCVYGKWLVQHCATGLACMSTTDGASIYCTLPSHKATSCSSPKAISCSSPKSISYSATELENPLSSCDSNIPKPFDLATVTIQVSVTHVTETSFEAVLNARRTTNQPFGRHISVQLTMPPNVTITELSSGSVTQSGPVADLQVTNTHNTSMSLVFAIRGTRVPGNVFVAPEVKNIEVL